MLVNLGKIKKLTYPVGLKENFEKDIQKASKLIDNSHNMDVVYVNYAEIVEDPKSQVDRINTFLGGQMNITEMVNAVSEKLYRTRK